MSFHICNVICSIIALFIYISFRFGVDSYLRVNKNSKTYIRKSKKGYLNYWTYKKINEDIGLGNIFHLNVFFVDIDASLFFCIDLFWLGEFFVYAHSGM